MLTERVVTEAVRAAGLDAPVHFFEVTGSTNTELLRLAEEDAASTAALRSATAVAKALRALGPASEYRVDRLLQMVKVADRATTSGPRRPKLAKRPSPGP